MKIGRYEFLDPLILAPMAGVSDRPFRQICRALGADYAVAEMVTADERLWHTDKTRTRLDLAGEAAPRVLQIAGALPTMLADAARRAVDVGADIVDINMGCPAKKVCNRLAGSALLRDEVLVAQILSAVCAAVSVPVTLKIRTGWSPDERNGVRIATIAEACGVQALTVHGRTRACAYRGPAEYATIAAIKAAVSIPVIANGDITSPATAVAVLLATGADGLMIGRAAHGNPWLFAAIKAARHGVPAPVPRWPARAAVMRDHVAALHAHYGDATGVRVARKHVGWYLEKAGAAAQRKMHFLRLDSAAGQLAFITDLGVNADLERAA